ncbi:MAG TPA: hypothetical protein DCZ04_02685 [Syntrophorhabdus aromaticivorans]|nr:hypothetical protein [Syntrophorhabdus aromaticivorans]
MLTTPTQADGSFQENPAEGKTGSRPTVPEKCTLSKVSPHVKDFKKALYRGIVRAFRETNPEENRPKKGGATIGHPGHGRKSVEADTVICLEGPMVCPECGGYFFYMISLDKTTDFF